MSSKPSNLSKSTSLPERVRRFAAAFGFTEPISVEPLHGGMSAQLFRVACSGRMAVARVPSKYIGMMVEDPVAYEAATLQALDLPSLTTPQVLAANEEMTLLTYCPGHATADPTAIDDYYGKFARALAAIHRAPTAGFEHLLPMRIPYQPRPAPWRSDVPEKELIDALMELPQPSLAPQVLRHGDFWPGNVLWADGEISAVIDWENALLGPAVADLAISQLDMWWIGGESAMREFTSAYLQEHPIPQEDMRYWQIRASLRPLANLEEWAAPYASLARPDVTPDGIVSGLREFVDRVVFG